MTVAPHIVGDRKTLERYVGYSRLIHTHTHIQGDIHQTHIAIYTSDTRTQHVTISDKQDVTSDTLTHKVLQSMCVHLISVCLCLSVLMGINIDTHIHRGNRLQEITEGSQYITGRDY